MAASSSARRPHGAAWSGACRGPSRARGGSLAARATGAELAAAVEAVRRACAMTAAAQPGVVAEGRGAKADGSSITVADYAAQALVAESLARFDPDIALVAEEDAQELRDGPVETLRAVAALVDGALEAAGAGALGVEGVLEAVARGGSPGGTHGRHWVLDPIDGTTGYASGRQYAVALALVEDGEVTLGVLGCPNLPAASVAGDPTAGDAGSVAPPGVLFAARKGAGATVAPLDDVENTRPIAFADPTAAGRPVRYMESYGDSLVAAHGVSASVAGAMGVTEPPTRLDSQAKYGAVARGDADLYMRFPPRTYREKIWDHAAGAVVITEAGGGICDGAGNPLDFSKGRYLDVDRAIVAFPPALRDEVLAAIDAALPPGADAA